MAASDDCGSIFGSPIFKLIGDPRKIMLVPALVRIQGGPDTRDALLLKTRQSKWNRFSLGSKRVNSSINRPEVASHDAKPSLTDAVLLYIVADKYMFHDLTRRIEGMFRKYFDEDIETAFSYQSYLRTLRETGLPECCGLKKVLLDNLAVDLRRHGWNMYMREMDPGLTEESLCRERSQGHVEVDGKSH
ncbi:hypothetical protein A1O7_04074 [Cladophialophora yegresii CBS 114405]|uniref:Uncharacterized protein n=1 Tax=Cladophialophora yegresii CBS 114405 TaxID=1182544 RepID=W9W5X2_9EURO|nr:uncharacterized protein A1O7_04074 [Cladophialophora yegresii CBS 114405]EXJ59926.1 hypothetical protein A1O7_04074 [Cladophialophora yegresii CBS 114405]